jgi:hypothetical protein
VRTLDCRLHSINRKINGPLAKSDMGKKHEIRTQNERKINVLRVDE